VRHPAITAAAILFFLNAGWVVSFLFFGASVVLTGDLPSALAQGRIYDAFGPDVTLVAHGLLAAVSLLSILAGLWLWRARRIGAVLGAITLAVGPVFWYGFGLPIPPYIAVLQLVLLGVAWKSLHRRSSPGYRPGHRHAASATVELTWRAAYIFRMAPLGALSQAWTSAEASLSLGWRLSGLYRFDELWVGLAEGPEYDDYASGFGLYAEQALRRLSDRLRERRGLASG
jgi:hypothetical protein